MMRDQIIAERYQLREPLGRGSFGVVWRADELLGGAPVARVAVKIFSAEVNRSEIALLAQLSHPQILGYRAVIEADGAVCLVTELADGGDAAMLLKQWPDGLPPHEVARVLWPVSEALIHLHERGWVHRDVKPANILFVGDQPKLGDVGTARALDGTARSTSTASLAYAAPELFSGAIAPSVDVYALGCTAYELLTGRLPFEGTMTELVHKHLFETMEIPEDVPAYLRSLIQGCTVKDPAQRWPLSRVRDTFSPPKAFGTVSSSPTAAHAGARTSSSSTAPRGTSPSSSEPRSSAAPSPRDAQPSPSQTASSSSRSRAGEPGASASATPKPQTPSTPKGRPAQARPKAEAESKPTERATPLDGALRRHLRHHAERWGEGEVWRTFMRTAGPAAREHGLGERDLIRRAQQLLPSVEGETRERQVRVARVGAWVMSQSSAQWSAPSWASFLDEVGPANEVELAGLRDAFVRRLHPPGSGATRLLDLGGGVQHLMIYRPIELIRTPGAQLVVAVQSGGRDPDGLKGLWFSAAPLTLSEWSALTGERLPSGATPSNRASSNRAAVDRLMRAAHRRFPAEELRLPKLLEYDGIKAYRQQTDPALKGPQRGQVPSRSRKANSIGEVLLRAAGKVASDYLKDMGEAWLVDTQPNARDSVGKRRMDINLVSPVPGGRG